MRKNYALLFIAMILIATNALAQKCYTDEMNDRLLKLHPELRAAEQNYDNQIREALKNIHYGKAMRTTDATGQQWYDIPVVVHLIHDYGVYSGAPSLDEYLPDDSIFNAITEWNVIYAGANTDTSTVIAPFKKYIGNPQIRLHLATIDPIGNPTHGITRHRSYLTYPGGDQAKLDDWSPTNYVNIWLVMNAQAANPDIIAYAYLPNGVTGSNAVYDGVIGKASWATVYNPNAYQPSFNQYSKIINHELGHVFGLYHPFGKSNNPCHICNGDDDDVDDTPPTTGHCANVNCVTTAEGCGCNRGPLYDTTCATGYFKIYPSVVNPAVDSLADYPDTGNSQNIMEYTECARMFTKGQVERMHAALNSTQAGRNNLWDTFNLRITGALAPFPDLKPIPEFSAISGAFSGATMQYFVCPNQNMKFINKSWNDTVTQLEMKFSNGAKVADTIIVNPSHKSYVLNSFSDPGWMALTMTATGNNTGDSTVVFNNAVFVSDAVGTPGDGYFQEFSPTGDVNKWPMFNYYNNEFKWSLCNTTGYYDNYCIKYNAFDSRSLDFFGQPVTGTPYGDFDDFYTVPFNLYSFKDTVCNLNFMYSGSVRSSIDYTVDTLQIDYTVNHGSTWSLLKKLYDRNLVNMGTNYTSYEPAPGDMSAWAPMTLPLPAGAKDSFVIFRFRYKPTVRSDYLDSFGVFASGGNNYYLDRINFSPYPSEISSVKIGEDGIAVAPNPTKHNAYVVIKNAGSVTAQITVTDITGKLVYSKSQSITGNDARVEIPESAISVKGIYMVNVVAGTKNSNQKLVVY